MAIKHFPRKPRSRGNLVPQSGQFTDYDILMYGTWPDFKECGVSKVVEDLLEVYHGAGKTVYLLTRDWEKPENLNALVLCQIQGDQPYNWRDVANKKLTFSSLKELLDADRSGALNNGQSLLKNVGIVHSHCDDLIALNDQERANNNNYGQLRDYLAKASGRKPYIIRTRHDEIHGGTGRINLLSGIDWEDLPDEVKRKYLDDGSPFREMVRENVAKNRENLKRLYHFSDKTLDDAVDHVFWALDQLKRWKQEANDVDSIVNLTHQDVIGTKKITLPGERNARKFKVIYNARSFEVENPDYVNGKIWEYHNAKGLNCYRGSNPTKEPIEFRPEDKKLIFVGRAEAAKGIFELAEAMAKLYQRGYTNARCIFVGGGFENPEIRRQLESYDPEHAKDYLLFTGAVTSKDELASIYKFGNATVVPSHTETFGLVGAESAKMGKPLVTTDFSATGEVFVDHPKKHGLNVALPVAKPNKSGPARYYGVDVDSLTDQLETIITDDELAVRMSQDAGAYAESHFKPEIMGDAYLDLFNYLITGKHLHKKTADAN
jgi:glycosyltransferase involved in cell wall biosynthesis